MLIKNRILQIRISDTLKSRYEEALRASGISKSDHINAAIHKFVEDHERKAKREVAAR